MKRSKLSALATAAVAGVMAVSLAAPAAADLTPQPRDIVGAGSDTTQFSMNYLADGATNGGLFYSGYNANANARLISFDAILADGSTGGDIVLKAGTPAITRPNGSTQGKALLFGTANNLAVNYARSSSSLGSSEVAAGLQLLPFAKDGIELAVRAAGTNAPATITPAQMVDIYEGSVTNWSQIGGANGVIVPMIPQSGSGTRATFISQLKAANGGVDVVLAASVIEVQEHDAAPIAANANAVAPFSTGRASFQPSINLVEGAGSWAYTRALYNVVRSADLSQPWVSQIFGSDGFICSGAATQLIAAAGFEQLASPLDGGVCGEPTQSATSNFTTN